jgi:Rrf2 family protein
MLRLNRTTEYGLMALKHMDRKGREAPHEVTSAREVADAYGLPFEITAKTLQRLKDTGLIHSEQGARGGYTLTKSLADITLAEFIELMEGPHSIVPCAETTKESHNCEYNSKCEIKHAMSDIDAKLFQFLSGIRLAELSEKQVSNLTGGEP